MSSGRRFVRVAIVAPTLPSARRLADLIAGDERLELVDVRAARELEQVPFAAVDVILCADLNLPQSSKGGPALVMLSDESRDAAFFAEIVRAWLPGNSSADEIVAALIAAANDLTVLTDAQINRWFTRSDPKFDRHSSFIEALTARELEVLRMLADGLGNKEVAGKLVISDHTVKFHVSQILAKLGAASRTEAVAIGIRRGLIPV